MFSYVHPPPPPPPPPPLTKAKIYKNKKTKIK